ncbi:MAG: heparinase II/III family protein [Spirochaetales bacterium]|nr:heparinase II/III family protein [Spirochaetales bacterium]
MLQTLLSGISEQLVLPFPGREYLPPAGERLWTELPPAAAEKVRREGESAFRAPLPALPITLYADFNRTGNRTRFEKFYFARRSNLIHLVKAYCLAPDDAYLDRIIDYLDALCGEWSWVVPAHNWPHGNSFPPLEPTSVDLFAANTSALLALTVHLLREPLERESSLLVERVKAECRRRCLDPFREIDDHWWMGFSDDPQGRHLNNWNPWITDNYLHTLFLIEEEESLLKRSVSRAAAVLNNYLDALPADGGCDEGPSYWDHAVGSLFDCLDILNRAGGGKTGLLTDDFLKKAGSYIYRMHICDDYFINYADCVGRLNPMPEGLMFRMGEAMGDGMMKALATKFHQAAQVDSFPELDAFSTQRQIRDLTINWPEESETTDVPSRDHFPLIQVGIVRTPLYTFSCKGGHNDESHNHNDVGQFILYGKKAPFLVDPGVGDYTRETFNNKRYTIWTMQSGWHNLPRINGCDQSPGGEYRCSRFDFTDEGCHLDLAKAYPGEARLISWQRFFTWTDESLTLRDAWLFHEKGREIIWNLLSLAEPRIEKGRVRITNGAGEELTITVKGIIPSWEKEYRPFPEGDKKQRAWKRDGIWRLKLQGGEPFPLKGSLQITFSL